MKGSLRSDVALLGLLFTPLLYVLAHGWNERHEARRVARNSAPQSATALKEH